MQAIIRFIPFERGGRTAPPMAEGYASVAKFERDPSEQPRYWSIRLRDVRQLNGPECVQADIEFLVPDHAPQELMEAGNRFMIFEGHKIVANGVLLSAALDVPASVDAFHMALLG